jgi:hypothetical protein
LKRLHQKSEGCNRLSKGVGWVKPMTKFPFHNIAKIITVITK